VSFCEVGEDIDGGVDPVDEDEALPDFGDLNIELLSCIVLIDILLFVQCHQNR